MSGSRRVAAAGSRGERARRVLPGQVDLSYLLIARLAIHAASGEWRQRTRMKDLPRDQ